MVTELVYQVRYDDDDKPYVKSSLVSSKSASGFYLKLDQHSLIEWWVPGYLLLIKYNPAEPVGCFFYYHTEEAAVEGRIAELEALALSALQRAADAKDKISTILSRRINYGDSLSP